jgi:hypothetical protein
MRQTSTHLNHATRDSSWNLGVVGLSWAADSGVLVALGWEGMDNYLSAKGFPLFGEFAFT